MLNTETHRATEAAVKSWAEVEPILSELLDRTLDSKTALEAWLKDRSTIEERLQEDMGWRYIRHTCDTEDKTKLEALDFFIQEIEPHLAGYTDKLNRKLLDCPFINELTSTGYPVYLRSVKKEVEIFREENIPLLTEIQTLSNSYGQISGSMTVDIDGVEKTLQQAVVELKSTDRERRKMVFEKINRRRLLAVNELNELFDSLFRLRHQTAINAGYANFRDYMFDSLGRFDYTPEQCFDFHNSIEKYIVPLIDDFNLKRKQSLGYEVLKPWDMDVDPEQKVPLHPYKNADELIQKTIALFEEIMPEFGKVIRLMQERGHLDLDSRIGKAPGGYNYPLHQSSLPFIFMNSAGTLRDMVTMMHEGGHAVHSWLSRNLELGAFKSTPSEIAEVASMAMELISMEHWNHFFNDAEELKRARKYQLEKILSILPWIAIVDAFQNWIYTHPQHSAEERKATWLDLLQRFEGNVVDRRDFPEFQEYSWHKQLHIFEVPFYYVEYGIAQLASIAIWKNYKENPAQTLNAYTKALEAGYTLTLPELYNLAGIKFNFSGDYIKEIASFVRAEYAKL